MKLRVIRTLFSLAAVSATYAAAAPLCEYAAYTPVSMQYFLSARLAWNGVATVPPSWNLINNQGRDELFLARDGHGYGFFKLLSDRPTGTTALIIMDAWHQEIARSEEAVFACGGGVCRQTILQMTIGGVNGSLGVTEDPYSGVSYSINGQPAVNATLWFKAFDDYVDQMMATFADSSRSIALPAYTRSQRLTAVLATDPEIIPYLSLLRLSIDRTGQMVLSGRTNYGIYHLIMDRALNAGFILKPEVIIDSSVRFGPPQMSHDLLSCLR